VFVIDVVAEQYAVYGQCRILSNVFMAIGCGINAGSTHTWLCWGQQSRCQSPDRRCVHDGCCGQAPDV